MKVFLCILLSLQGMGLLHAGSISLKKPRKDRHERILRKKQKKWDLRPSGQIWPDQYGYQPYK